MSQRRGSEAWFDATRRCEHRRDAAGRAAGPRRPTGDGRGPGQRAGRTSVRRTEAPSGMRASASVVLPPRIDACRARQRLLPPRLHAEGRRRRLRHGLRSRPIVASAPARARQEQGWPDLPPLTLGYLAAQLRAGGHEVERPRPSPGRSASPRRRGHRAELDHRRQRRARDRRAAPRPRRADRRGRRVRDRPPRASTRARRTR